MDDILKLGRRASYASGEILLRPSDTGGTIFIITKGMVHVYTIEQSGIKNIHVMYGPGDYFPITWVISKKPMHLFFEAVTDCEVVKIPDDDLEEYLQSNPEATLEIMRQMARQFIAYKANVDMLQYKYARERVAYRLLLIARRFGKPTDNGLCMHRLSQDEIASSTNVSRESVNRELRRFERLGCISYEQGKQMFIDPEGLRKELAPVDSPLFIDDL